ncbi:hypothetical protein [Erythrobacter oryzae]|uniref:hypothetical protein n=1 Tax=Erythrobacter oryzae TaxID=3019556 RepID=UPI002555BF51|nr:hypothetical protein [Erythrobacter sp. COR-2]
MNSDILFAQAASTTKDRSIVLTCRPKLTFVQVTPSLEIQAPNIVFEQTLGHPTGMEGRVDEHGDINLTDMPFNAEYTDNVDITINLDSSLLFDPNGNRVTGRWAFVDESSGQGETGFGWFCGTDAAGKYSTKIPIPIDGMRIERLNDMQLRINDDTPKATPEYAYAIALVLPAYNNYYITIDPRITTKTTNTSS